MAKSKLTKSQFILKEYVGDKIRLKVKIRYDDQCGNGHNSFAITCDACEKTPNGNWSEYFGGSAHDEIVKYFPELKPYIKWHLMSSDGPMHYVSNSMYHASDRDYNGLLKGEKRQIKDGKTSLPAWQLVAINKKTNEETSLYDLTKNIDSETEPSCDYVLEYRPWCRIGEGKAPDLEAARSCAIWPDAQLEDFTEEKLAARLPILIADFKRDVESLGLVF